MTQIERAVDTARAFRQLTEAFESELTQVRDDTGKHPLIGKPCLYQSSTGLLPCLPYRAFLIEANVHCEAGVRFNVAVWEPEGQAYSFRRKAKPMCLAPHNLIPLDPTSDMGIEVYSTILQWLVHSWDEQEQVIEKYVKEREQLLDQIPGD